MGRPVGSRPIQEVSASYLQAHLVNQITAEHRSELTIKFVLYIFIFILLVHCLKMGLLTDY